MNVSLENVEFQLSNGSLFIYFYIIHTKQLAIMFNTEANMLGKMKYHLVESY